LEVKMSDNIRLDNLKSIKKWIEKHMPAERHLVVQSVDEILKAPIREPRGKGVFYGVQHILYADDGSPLVAFGRVYRAKNAEEALERYVFGPSRHVSGKGEQCIDVTLYDDFKRAVQEITVFRLAEGTDKFL
jgi:hypothetical protein